MLIQIGTKTSLAQNLAEKVFNNEIVDFNNSLLPELNPSDFVIVNLDTLTEEQAKILKEASYKNITLILENVTTDKLAMSNLSGSDAELVIVENYENAYNQTFTAYEDKKFGSDLENKIGFLTEYIKKRLNKNPIEKKQIQENSFTFKMPKSTKSASSRYSTSDFYVPDLYMPEPYMPESPDLPEEKPFHRHLDLQHRVWSAENSTQNNTYGPGIEIEVGMSNDPSYKLLKITSSNSFVSVPINMENNDEHRKGYFNYGAEYILIPGVINYESYTSIMLKTFDFTTIEGYKGWLLKDSQPNSPNNENEVVITTGWTFGLEGGVSKNEGASAKGSATYSTSKQISQKIKDFRCKRSTTSLVCHWHYEYSQFVDDWWELIEDNYVRWNAIKSLAAIATSTLDIKNEVVYLVPVDFEFTSVYFTIVMCHYVCELRVHGYGNSNVAAYKSVDSDYWTLTIPLGTFKK